MVTTTTTLPTSTIDDASSEERVETMAEEADIEIRRVLCGIAFVKTDSPHNVRLFT
jgi:hypothetical protein